MTKKHLITIIICLGLSINCFAQNITQTKQYPKNFFRYPLDLTPSTAGSFGELRPDHFHSGLDFKTNGQTGYPVHAAYDGYVSRLRVQFGGYGNSIYITHPNGYTTVYGHIERFRPDLEKLVREEQNQLQSFTVDVKLPNLQIQVCKDDVIAWSGNEGASAGPHLHFEIRDAQTEQAINPQLFGLTVPDNIPPTLGTICVYQLGNAPFSENTPRQFVEVVGAAGNYHLKKTQIINVNGKTGFGITATDMNNSSPNHNGIYSIELKIDGARVYTFDVERFAFDQTRAINAYIDYPTFLISHRYIQKCFKLPGNKISLYLQAINNGVIDFNDDAIHEVEYIVKDIAGNTSSLKLNVKANPFKTASNKISANTVPFYYDRPNKFSNDQVKVMIPVGNLYDDLNFTYSTLPKKPGMLSAVHCIHNRFTPINDSFELWIKPDNTIGKNINKAVIVNTEGACEGGTYIEGYIKANARNFGNYYIKLDTVPPLIRPLNIRDGANMTKLQRISLKIGDNLSGVKSYIGKIDGKWVLMEWDFKTKVLNYKFGKDITSGKHIFDLSVTDNKDNISKFTAYFLK